MGTSRECKSNFGIDYTLQNIFFLYDSRISNTPIGYFTTPWTIRSISTTASQIIRGEGIENIKKALPGEMPGTWEPN